MTSIPASRTSLQPKELDAMLREGRDVLVLDVREPDEYQDWRIPGSANLPVGRILEGAPAPARAKDALVVTVCAHGHRSARAREALAGRGLRVLSLEGGMVAWNSVYRAVPVPVEGAEVLQVRRVGKGCLAYLVASRGEAAAVDPSVDVEELLDLARERDLRIVTTLDTHAHADHASGARRLAEAAGAEYLAPDEVGAPPADRVVREGDAVRVGDVELRVLHTPGHTPGSVTYLVGDAALTGDALFVESVGRPDLGQDPRPNAAVLWETLQRRLLALPPDTLVLPAHHGGDAAPRSDAPVAARLADLKARLPALSMTKEAFADWVARNPLPKPGNFETLKKLNKGAVRLDDVEEIRELEAGPNRCAVGG